MKTQCASSTDPSTYLDYWRTIARTRDALSLAGDINELGALLESTFGKEWLLNESRDRNEVGPLRGSQDLSSAPTLSSDEAMLFGRANDGELVLATPRAVASCPGCGAALRGKCGAAKKQVWHWAHVTKECDPWHEGEGEWHLAWKSRATKDCTEVVIGPHRADIRTREGVVIELQASPIDAIEIAERETFYDQMIWLLDGRAWRSAGGFRFARGRFRRCDACTTELPGGMLRTRGGCALCRSGRVLDRSLGDRYLWDNRRRSFDDASRPVYVDTGENVVRLDGPPNRFGKATVIAYADFCATHGLVWDPLTDGAAIQPEREDSLPDIELLPPRAPTQKRPVTCPTVAKAPEPQDGVHTKIIIDEIPLGDASSHAGPPASVMSVALHLRQELEQSTCANHDARALVIVAIHGSKPGWAIHHPCCIQLSQKLVASLKGAQRQLRTLARQPRPGGR